MGARHALAPRDAGSGRIADLNDAFTIWSLASALGVIVLGAFSLLGGRTRLRGGLAFGLFGVFWGLHIAFGALLGLASDAGFAALASLLMLVSLLPLPYFLVEFVLAQAGTRRTLATQVARFGAGGLALVLAAVLVVSPSLLYGGVAVFQGVFFPQWGVLYAPLAAVPLFIAFGLALLAFDHARVTAATPRAARMTTLFLAGVGIYVAYAAGNNLAYYLGTGESATYTILFSALAVACIHVARRILLEGRGLHWVAACILVPLVYGAVEGFLSVELLPYLNTVGLWRLGSVGCIAYALARGRIYDLPQRVSTGAAATGGTAAAIAGGATTYGVAFLALGTVAIPALAGLVVAGASLVPSIRFMKRLVGRAVDDPVAGEDRLYGQRIDTYRAALEAALARGTLTEDEEFLAALRGRFGISAEEDRVLRYYAKSSVLVPRDGGTGAYERLRLLGEGGGGRTWLARDRARDRLVVLKEPLERWQREPALKDAVLREARLAARVRHANVVAIEEVIEQEGSPVIVMEYLDGGTLGDLLASRGTLPVKEAASLMIEVLRGVEAVHGAGIVHRDVKPSNILLTSDGTPKIGDFGVALIPNARKTVVDVKGPFGTDAGAPVDGDTMNTLRAGTPVYMAPEVRAGATLGDRRADVYACAAVLHECLYGSPPAPDAALVTRTDIPALMTTVLARGLAAKPDQRYATARAFAEDLQKVVRP